MLDSDTELTKINSKIDIWGAGFILYELCLGSRPFDTEKMINRGEIINTKEFPQLNERISKDLRNVISFMLEKDFSLRPSIDQVLGCKIIID